MLAGQLHTTFAVCALNLKAQGQPHLGFVAITAHAPLRGKFAQQARQVGLAFGFAWTVDAQVFAVLRTGGGQIKKLLGTKAQAVTEFVKAASALYHQHMVFFYAFCGGVLVFCALRQGHFHAGAFVVEFDHQQLATGGVDQAFFAHDARDGDQLAAVGQIADAQGGELAHFLRQAVE